MQRLFFLAFMQQGSAQWEDLGVPLCHCKGLRRVDTGQRSQQKYCRCASQLQRNNEKRKRRGKFPLNGEKKKKKVAEWTSTALNQQAPIQQGSRWGSNCLSELPALRGIRHMPTPPPPPSFTHTHTHTRTHISPPTSLAWWGRGGGTGGNIWGFPLSLLTSEATPSCAASHIRRRFNGPQHDSIWTPPLEASQAAAMPHRPMPPGLILVPTRCLPPGMSVRRVRIGLSKEKRWF